MIVTHHSNPQYQQKLSYLHELYGGHDGPGCYKLRCAVCGDTFFAARWEARYCTIRCANKAFVARRRQRLAEVQTGGLSLPREAGRYGYANVTTYDT